MFKRFILLVIAISTLLLANHANGEKQIECANGEIPVLRDVRDPSSVIKCIPKTDYDKSLLPEWAREYKVLGISEEDYNERLKHRFNKDQIIEWFVIGLVIIAIMSLPINILWRFRFKIPAYLFAMVTALAVIAIPFIFGS
ncbi:hypothetical protein ME1_00795 [Bartonella vinsonii subsp. arupensis OK-94-513]|uniref:Integral membrane protein n=1 Tax=Bartonella vinsonii subsp. arupensis OK-94-513 TaxID=1094562 RepID=J0QY55_BARVI|nr:hypothetical protein [Bartonella vinsonii]EJF88129.1 hypothetical protein ME1_00795 [Bartonella vinsonii subsp. arupensis OK-94-513]